MFSLKVLKVGENSESVSWLPFIWRARDCIWLQFRISHWSTELFQIIIIICPWTSRLFCMTVKFKEWKYWVYLFRFMKSSLRRWHITLSSSTVKVIWVVSDTCSLRGSWFETSPVYSLDFFAASSNEVLEVDLIPQDDKLR